MNVQSSKNLFEFHLIYYLPGAYSVNKGRDKSNLQHGLGLFHRFLILFVQSSPEIETSEAPLHRPAVLLRLKALGRFWLLSYFHFPPMCVFHMVDEGAAVAV